MRKKHTNNRLHAPIPKQEERSHMQTQQDKFRLHRGKKGNQNNGCYFWDLRDGKGAPTKVESGLK